VLTLLGAYARDRGRRIWSGGFVALLGEFGFSAGASRVALARLVRRDLLRPTRNGRLVYYELTPRCEQLLADGDRRIFAFGRRDAEPDAWTVLWHAIPEARRISRARLASRLRFLGFGSLQDGTWLAPHDHEEELVALLHELGVAEHAGVLVGQPARSLAFGALVARVWKLDELARRYAVFAAEFAAWREEDARAEIDDREAFLVRTRLTDVFRRLPPLDPELPGPAAAESGRREAVALFQELFAALAPAAQRYFDAATAGPPPPPFADGPLIG
jgi:phenylacetic acid degradation operon negative regulatory protein